jgi:acyl-CoA thioesterase I
MRLSWAGTRGKLTIGSLTDSLLPLDPMLPSNGGGEVQRENFYRLGAVLLTLLTLSACGRGGHLRALRPDSVVLAFGDSLTSGVDVETDETYPQVLKRLLGCEVVNAGIPGELSAEGLRRLPGSLEKYHPDLVILCHGGNDLLASAPDALIAPNIRAMIETVRAKGVDLILIAPPRPSLRLKAPAFYGKLGAELFVPCDHESLGRILSSPRLKGDPIHPNAEGNKELADAVARLIKENGPRQ